MFAELDLDTASDFARDGGEHLLGEVHQVLVVGVGLVELEHGEFGIVARGDAFVAEVAIDLVYTLEASYDQALEVELGRDAQVEVDVERVVMRDERPGDGAAGDGLHHGGFNFDVAARVEEGADGFHDLAALDEDVAHLRIHEEVDVALAVTEFDVGEPVPFLGERQQVFGKEGQFFDVNAELAGARAKQITARADVIAEVEQFVKVESFFTDRVFFHVDLEALALLLDVRESGLAHEADGHDASGDASVDAIGFELLGSLLAVVGENLRDGVCGLVMIRIGLLAERFDLAQLVFAKVINVLVECHFAQGRPEGRGMMSARGDYSEEKRLCPAKLVLDSNVVL